MSYVPPPSPNAAPVHEPIPNHLAWAIVSTVLATCLCCPLGLVGIVAIVFSAKVNGLLRAVPLTLWLLAKLYFFIFFYMWIRATLPRYRYDQLMAISWKFLLPLSLATLLMAAFMKQAGWL